MKTSRKHRSRKKSAGNGPQPLLKKDLRPGNLKESLELAQQFLSERAWEKIIEITSYFASDLPDASTVDNSLYYRLQALSFAGLNNLEKLEEAIAEIEKVGLDQLDLAYLQSVAADIVRERTPAIAAGQSYLDELRKDERAGHIQLTRADHYQASIHLLLGRSFCAINDLEKGMDHFREATAICPDHQQGYLELARCSHKTSGETTAAEILAKGISLCKDTAELRMLQRHYEPRDSVSACMIVRNEENMLAGCLESIRDWVDEIIIVDTGSNDRSIEIAGQYGARIFEQEWQDDFSYHRNFSIQQATGDWILIIDADERLATEDIDKLVNAIKRTGNRLISLTVENRVSDDSRVTSATNSVRLFKRELELTYRGIVHNELQIPPDEKITSVPAKLIHYGYHLELPRMTEKFDRTKRLLRKQIRVEPKNAFALFNYAQQLCNEDANFGTDNSVAIVDAAQKTISLTKDKPERKHLWIMSLYQLAQAYFKLEDYARALDYCRQAVAMKPNYLDAIIQAGFCAVKRSNYPEAARWFQLYLKEQATFDPSRDSESLIIWHIDSCVIALNNLGIINEMAGDVEQATEYYRAVLVLDQEHENARQRLKIIGSGESSITNVGPITRPDIDTSLRIARNTYKNGHSSQALEILKAVKIDDMTSAADLTEYYRLKAFALTSMNQLREAEEMVASGRKVSSPTVDFDYLDAFIKLNLLEHDAANSFALRYLQKIEDGEIDVDDMAATDAHRAQAWNFVGVCRLNFRQNADAVEAFQKAISLDPSNHLPYLNYIRLARSTGQHDLAGELIGQGLKHCSQVQELRLLANWSEKNSTISACLIVKNEEKLLPGCLDSIRDWVDEIIVVDTGTFRSNRLLQIGFLSLMPTNDSTTVICRNCIR